MCLAYSIRAQPVANVILAPHIDAYTG